VSADVPTLARRAANLCDDYAVARETILRLATEGETAASAREAVRSACADLATALREVGEVLDVLGEGRWWARADACSVGVVEPDAWSLELLHLAQGVEDADRTTEPDEARALDAATIADRDHDEDAWDRGLDQMTARILAGAEPEDA
jgi:hypothetical protein